MQQNFLSPELIQLLAQAGVIPERRSDLDQQLMQAQALRQNQPHFSGMGGLYGGLGNVINSITSGLMQNSIMKQKQQLLDQLASTGGQYGQAYADEADGLPGLGMLSPMRGLSPRWQPPPPNPYGLEDT